MVCREGRWRSKPNGNCNPPGWPYTDTDTGTPTVDTGAPIDSAPSEVSDASDDATDASDG